MGKEETTEARSDEFLQQKKKVPKYASEEFQKCYLLQ